MTADPKRRHAVEAPGTAVDAAPSTAADAVSSTVIDVVIRGGESQAVGVLCCGELPRMPAGVREREPTQSARLECHTGVVDVAAGPPVDRISSVLRGVSHEGRLIGRDACNQEQEGNRDTRVRQVWAVSTT